MRRREGARGASKGQAKGVSAEESAGVEGGDETAELPQDVIDAETRSASGSTFGADAFGYFFMEEPSSAYFTRKRTKEEPGGDADADEPSEAEPPVDGKSKRSRPASTATARAPASSREADELADGEAPSVDMSLWSGTGVCYSLLQALGRLNFVRPTPIQEACLPAALAQRKDIVGAAETGSGKTLAFGLPILQYLLERADDEKGRDKRLVALILTPTRELALQVRDHLVAVTGKRVRICAIVGGMSVHKQARLLAMRSEVVVATPGRLWELMSSGEEHVRDLSGVKFLVLDEADRMVDAKHFAEVDKILERLWFCKDGAFADDMQKFLFSATLTFEPSGPRGGSKGAKPAPHTLEKLTTKLHMRRDVHVADVTSLRVVAASLAEAHVTCSLEEKDVYLYYFLRKHPGRTLIFVNSIDCIRRLLALLVLLHLQPLGLHANMQQRQRLKNLDRFRADPRAVAVATDVAARGLDIRDVMHVVHYQLPRTADLYVHRAGRAARAGAAGMSVAIIGPQDLRAYRALCGRLRSGDGLPALPVDSLLLPAVRKIVTVARRIEKAMHSARREQDKRSWFKKAADEADLALDEDMLGIGPAGAADGDDPAPAKRAQQQKLRSLSVEKDRSELARLLSQPLVPTV